MVRREVRNKALEVSLVHASAGPIHEECALVPVGAHDGRHPDSLTHEHLHRRLASDKSAVQGRAPPDAAAEEERCGHGEGLGGLVRGNRPQTGSYIIGALTAHGLGELLTQGFGLLRAVHDPTNTRLHDRSVEKTLGPGHHEVHAHAHPARGFAKDRDVARVATEF